MGEIIMYKNNVIDFVARREQKKAEETIETKTHSENADLVDITEKRAEIIKQERREVKRTILTEFISAHVVIPSRGLQKVAIHDISDNGIAFELDSEEGAFGQHEELAMRVYLNSETYFPFFVKVKSCRLLEQEGVYRVGSQFDKESFNSEALSHFVKFIETVSANLKSDSGDIMVSNIK